MTINEAAREAAEGINREWDRLTGHTIGVKMAAEIIAQHMTALVAGRDHTIEVQGAVITKAHDLLTAAGIQEGGDLTTRVEQLLAHAESERAERIRQSNLTLQDINGVVEHRTKVLREQLAEARAEVERLKAELNSTWDDIIGGFDVEPRSFFEAEAARSIAIAERNEWRGLVDRVTSGMEQTYQRLEAAEQRVELLTGVLMVWLAGQEGIESALTAPAPAKQIWTAWGLADSPKPCTFHRGEGQVVFGDGTTDPDCQKLFWRIEATDYDDAQRQYHELQGWEPYKPIGDIDAVAPVASVADTIAGINLSELRRWSAEVCGYKTKLLESQGGSKQPLMIGPKTNWYPHEWLPDRNIAQAFEVLSAVESVALNSEVITSHVAIHRTIGSVAKGKWNCMVAVSSGVGVGLDESLCLAILSACREAMK